MPDSGGNNSISFARPAGQSSLSALILSIRVKYATEGDYRTQFSEVWYLSGGYQAVSLATAVEKEHSGNQGCRSGGKRGKHPWFVERRHFQRRSGAFAESVPESRIGIGVPARAQPGQHEFGPLRMPSVRIVAKLAELAFHFALSGFEKRRSSKHVTFEVRALLRGLKDGSAPGIDQFGGAECRHVGRNAQHLAFQRNG